jgi:quinolinate synthase
MELEEYKKLPEAELIARIEKAKKEKNAIILAHNYQKLEVQQVADYLGDSLGLSRIAAETDADVVVFCGVDFMAESAKILSPDKTVLLPEIEATCPMANMITPENLIKAKAENPDSIVVAYVNTTARVKALVDICCTSANALNIVKSLPGKEILFVPDKNLGDYIGKTTGAKINPWNGYCYVHNFLSVEDVKREREAHPDAVFLVHPESPPEVVALADEVLSTSGMVKYVENINTDADKKRGVIIGTEIGIIHQLRKTHPDVNIWALSDFAVCGTMKMTTLPKVCWSIETGNYEVTLPDDVMDKARIALEKMIAVS